MTTLKQLLNRLRNPKKQTEIPVPQESFSSVEERFPETKLQGFRAILFKEGKYWTAQCLEIDLSYESGTEIGAFTGLIRTYTGQAKLDQGLGREPFSELLPAPPNYWDKWDKSSSYGFFLLDNLPLVTIKIEGKSLKHSEICP